MLTQIHSIFILCQGLSDGFHSIQPAEWKQSSSHCAIEMFLRLKDFELISEDATLTEKAFLILKHPVRLKTGSIII